MAQNQQGTVGLSAGRSHAASDAERRQSRKSQADSDVFTEELNNALSPLLGQPSSTKQRIGDAVHQASQKYGVPKKLICAVIKQESAFKPNATSHCGAQGLMQLMPATAKDMGVKDAYNIEQNVEGGTKYLSRMLKMFGGDTKLALAAYNAGPGNVKKYGGIPPFSETQKYVRNITANLDRNITIPDRPAPNTMQTSSTPKAQALIARETKIKRSEHMAHQVLEVAMTSAINEATLANTMASQIVDNALNLDDSLEQERNEANKRPPLPPHAILV